MPSRYFSSFLNKKNSERLPPSAPTTGTSLYLDDESTGNEGALTLSDALKTNTILTTLSLYRNVRNLVGKEGALALSEALMTNITLSTLKLDSNSIGIEGGRALSEDLKISNTLRLKFGNIPKIR
ncbi:hypothetical protein BGZ76_010813 [Entomortierella beljakovae]|nr:hypothetical protein BGZ76_010813 [Entomortierella beljakovae]